MSGCDPGRHHAGPETETICFSGEYLLGVLPVALDCAGNACSLKANSESAKKKVGAYKAVTRRSHGDVILL